MKKTFLLLFTIGLLALLSAGCGMPKASESEGTTDPYSK